MLFRYLLLALTISSFGYGQIPIKEQVDPRTYEGQVTDLSGQWEFYWNQLLTPDELKDRQPTEWIQVPGAWSNHSEHPMLGYATYRTKVKLTGEQVSQSLYLPMVNTAAKVWINGQWLAKSGKVGTSADSAAGRLSSMIIPIPDHVADIDIVIQVSNFNFYAGGMEGKPVIRETAKLVTEISRRNGVENLFAGCLVALFGYQIILYFLYHRGKPYLWLSLICLGVAIRSMTMHGGSFLLPELFPSVSWEIWKKMEFGSVYAIMALFPLLHLLLV